MSTGRHIYTFGFFISVFQSVSLSVFLSVYQACDDGWTRRLEEQQEQSRKQEETNTTRLKVYMHTFSSLSCASFNLLMKYLLGLRCLLMTLSA